MLISQMLLKNDVIESKETKEEEVEEVIRV